MTIDQGRITVLLKAMRAGNSEAENDLLPLVYQELHRLAQSYMRRERPDHTLQPTALIHEAYLRLAGGDVDWKNREHFIGVAAHVMRRVLVDHARAGKQPPSALTHTIRKAASRRPIDKESPS